jgi:hypothetical protein
MSEAVRKADIDELFDGPCKPKYEARGPIKKRFRPSKGRNRSAKDIARGKAFLAKKAAERAGKYTNDGLNSSTEATGAVLSVPAPKVEVSANPPVGSFIGPYYKLPLPTPNELFPAPPPEAILTKSQALDRGYPVRRLNAFGVDQYLAPGAKYWTSCAGQSEPAPPTTGKFMSPLYDRPAPKNFNKTACVGVCSCTDRDCARK